MAQINKPVEYFNTKLWSGNNTDPTTISGLNFQPDMIWGKARSGTYSTQDHCINDAVRGANNILRVNQNNAEETDDNNIKSFTSDGWTMGNDGKINQASTEYVGWSWKANGSGSANTDGSISSTVSANTTSGFSIVKYTGTSANATIGHGLSAVPKMIIVKNLDQTDDWYVYHVSRGATQHIILNSTGTGGSNATLWQNTEPTSSVFSIGTNNVVNTSGENYIAYCFADVKGFSKFGSYVGNGNADGTFVYTGFKPAFVMIKRTDSADAWFMFDNKRAGAYSPNTNPSWEFLLANATNAGANTDRIDLYSNGFKMRFAWDSINASGGSYIYMAFAENPLVGTNNIPATAR